MVTKTLDSIKPTIFLYQINTFNIHKFAFKSEIFISPNQNFKKTYKALAINPSTSTNSKNKIHSVNEIPKPVPPSSDKNWLKFYQKWKCNAEEERVEIDSLQDCAMRNENIKSLVGHTKVSPSKNFS
ncbi:hypothetical protein BpHYR1_024961 [Brachionus plicatilis]|uniref:Uncharacterized protein n=1 Tax=Brachionus plicatilis TaxID=10195 RepID=A0A3M7P7L0_BRAPC|nr:hypothetical protein BpHYR1_024961 [Brachionus plicatilis]